MYQQIKNTIWSLAAIIFRVKNLVAEELQIIKVVDSLWSVEILKQEHYLTNRGMKSHSTIDQN